MIDSRSKLIGLITVCLVIMLQILLDTSCESNEQNDVSNTSTEINDKENQTSKEKFVVRFITDSGIPISTKECKKGETLMPPTPPYRIGKIFVGWNGEGEYTNITRNTDIIANYTDISKISNAISADTVYASGTATFEVAVGIYGMVDFCGLDMDITYDSGLLEYVDSTEVDDCVMLNSVAKGVIHMNYATANNTTGEVSFMTLRFKSKVNIKTETSLRISINSMYSLENGDELVSSKYQVIQNKIVIEEVHDE